MRQKKFETKKSEFLFEVFSDRSKLCFYARKQNRFSITTENVTPRGSHNVDSHLSSVNRESDCVFRRVSTLPTVPADDDVVSV